MTTSPDTTAMSRNDQIIRSRTRNLKMSYDPASDLLWLRDGSPSDGSSLLEEAPFATIEMLDEGSREAVGVEISGFSSYLPLRRPDYCASVDTLTVGARRETATVVAENGDLVAYWRPDESAPGDLEPFAVDLRNASKHMAPLLATFSRKK